MNYKKLLSVICAASVAASSFVAMTFTASADDLQEGTSSQELTYKLDGNEFSSITYGDSDGVTVNGSKKLSLDGTTELGEGTVTVSFKLGKLEGESLTGLSGEGKYRAGMKFDGKTIYINAMGSTSIGNWPDGSEKYFINYNYRYVPEVTYTFTLNSEGNVAGIHCVLDDNNGNSVTGDPDITFVNPVSMSTIELVTDTRGGSETVTLADFGAIYTPKSETSTPDPETPATPDPEDIVHYQLDGGIFSEYTYDSPDKNNKILQLPDEEKIIGNGVLTLSFKLGGAENGQYRAGMEIAGKTIYVNALDGNTAKGNWPDGSGVYFMNYKGSLTADVTYTVTVIDGNATKIECLLTDSAGGTASGSIEVEEPASVNEIKLRTENRPNNTSGNFITLSDFIAIYTSETPATPEPEGMLHYQLDSDLFGEYTYDSDDANNKTLKLPEDENIIGNGVLTLSFKLNNAGNCQYRAGMVISGETIFVNAMSRNDTVLGDWPVKDQPNNPENGCYHMNYNGSLTAEVTYTVTVIDGKATKINCLLRDSAGGTASDIIEIKDPAPVNEINLRTGSRGGDAYITLSDFKAMFVKNTSNFSIDLGNPEVVYGTEDYSSEVATVYVATISNNGVTEDTATKISITVGNVTKFDGVNLTLGKNASALVGIILNNVNGNTQTVTAKVE